MQNVNCSRSACKGKQTGKRGQRRREVPGMSDRGCCLRWLLTVALDGDRRWLFFSFSPLLLLPLAFHLFYCSSSFFPFSPLVLGKEKPMVMLSFVCWFLASLTFSSSLFLLPIPCSAASGSCRWCCRKVKLMVICFSYFSLLGGPSHAGFFLLGLAPVWFSRFYSLLLPLFLLFLVRSSFVFVCVFLSLLPPVSIASPSVFFLFVCLSSLLSVSPPVFPHCHLSSLVSFLLCRSFFFCLSLLFFLLLSSSPSFIGQRQPCAGNGRLVICM